MAYEGSGHGAFVVDGRLAAYLVDVQEARELRFVVRVALDFAGGGGREEDGFSERSAGVGGGAGVEVGVAVEHGGDKEEEKDHRMRGAGS